MKWSTSYLQTLKENPADAEIPSHRLLVRGGYIRKVAPGIFSYSQLLVRSLRKLENILREELEKIDCQEVLLPMVHPKELWDETGRWDKMGAGLLKFKNRNQHDFCLGATHEEVITDFVRHGIKSYRDLPVSLFQIQTKFRDEIRPRFGLMRGREFIMKDAYTFDRDVSAAQESYKKMHGAYVAIFDRLGLQYRVVQADSGQIGGSQSQEFQILAESGEDRLLVSTESDFAANIEICPAPVDKKSQDLGDALPLEEFATPGLRTIEDLHKSIKVAQDQLVKTLYFATTEDPTDLKPIAVLLRGCDEGNPHKIKNLLGLANPPLLLTDQEVKKLTGAMPGSCGPVGLKIPVYVDQALEGRKNFIVGANKDDFHLKNVNFDRDFKVKAFADLRMAAEGMPSPDGKGQLKEYRGIEVGHIFYLGKTYSEAMKAQFLDEGGKSQTVEMGCYGIGVTRTLQAAIEQCHDADGIIWPFPLAPFSVHVCLLDPKDKDCARLANEVYEELPKAGFEVLMDDRDERAGVKFKDADLLGMPFRLTLGGRGVKSGEVEWVDRKTKEMTKLPIDKLSATLIEKLKFQSQQFGSKK
ncbi:MAG: proline--tRNA ligase [Bdellovibrionales bacterium]|nr:proline--tRNA ligase [Bdellovibrionales bacterium]